MIKMLVVDDEPGICDAIEQIFSYVGFSVLTATDSAKALSTFKKERPKIIFLDINMPKMNGLDLLKELKKIDPNCIVFMITALEDADLKKRAMELGASEFIQKPFSHNYLRDVAVGKIQNVLDQGGHMQKPRILVADDEEDVLEGMRKAISKTFEAEIELARSGEEAIQKSDNFRPDVVFLDIKMPGITGLEAIPEIKKKNPDVKIFVVSGWISMEVLNQAAGLGITDYITKPAGREVIIEKLKAALMSIGKLILKDKK